MRSLTLDTHSHTVQLRWANGTEKIEFTNDQRTASTKRGHKWQVLILIRECVVVAVDTGAFFFGQLVRVVVGPGDTVAAGFNYTLPVCDVVVLVIEAGDDGVVGLEVRQKRQTIGIVIRERRTGAVFIEL